MADKANSVDGLNVRESEHRPSPQKKDSTPPRADRNLPILAIVETLSFEASGAGKRGYQKVGWGEFEPGDGTRSADYLRYLFLEEIREMELSERSWRSGRKQLTVLKELGGSPLAVFKKAKPSIKQLHQLYAKPNSRFDPGLLTVQESLEIWARRWHLDAPWCLITALATLKLWTDYPKAHELLLWDNNFPVDEATLLLPKEVADTTPFPGLPPFFAHIELRSTYTRRMKERIRSQIKTDPLTAKVGIKLQMLILSSNMKKIKAYCDQVESVYEHLYDQQGAPVWRRVRERAALRRDIRWTIEFQVRGTSARAIANKEEIKRSLSGNTKGLPHTTVTRAVSFILELIDLPNRTKKN